MDRAVSILGICGSMRVQSLNARLLRGMAGRLDGARVEVADLRDFPMPVYDGDLEGAKGVPECAVALRRTIMGHDGLLIACPEHNGSVSALLKNTLDWCSRPTGDMDGLAPFRQRPVLIIGTSVSPFGAVRAIGHLRAILSKMGALVFPEDFAVPDGGHVFAVEGQPISAGQGAMMDKLGQGFIDFVRRTTSAVG